MGSDIKSMTLQIDVVQIASNQPLMLRSYLSYLSVFVEALCRPFQVCRHTNDFNSRMMKKAQLVLFMPEYFVKYSCLNKSRYCTEQKT